MNFKENYKEAKEINFSNRPNKKNENNGTNLNYDRISAINTPLTKNMLKDINIYNNRADKPLGCLIYKSIFNNADKNNNNNNINGDNYIENGKMNYLYNTSNKKLVKNNNQKYINYDKNNHDDLLQENNEDIYFYNNNNIDELEGNLLSNETNADIINVNYIGGMLSNDIKYQKQYSFQKEYNTQTYNNSKTINANEYNNDNPNMNETEQNMINTSKVLIYQKSEDNLNKNKIMDKQDFFKNIKEIDDLELIDENNALFSDDKFMKNKNNNNPNIYKE